MIYKLKKVYLLLILILLSFVLINLPVLATGAIAHSNGLKVASSDVTTNSANSSKSISDIHINEVSTKSKACLLMDAKSGEILYAKNVNEKLYPASTTKLMTAILALEKCKLTDVATVSHNAIFSIPVGYSHANLKEGEHLTIEQLLNVLLIPSANDAAVVLAEHISGSVEEFSKLMNAKAKELGCSSTNFVNPNGIHDKNHYSCAYDLALIGKYAMKFSDIMRIAMVKQYTLPTTNKYNKTNRIFNATNALINNESMNKNYYPYATGLKTGYTDSAGSCIVSTAKKGNMQLIAVILKSKSTAERYNDCKNLFDYGFNNYSYKTLKSSGTVVKTIEVSNATKETKQLDVSIKDDISLLLSSKIKPDELEPIIEIKPDLKAPIADNTVIGKISYKIDGKIYSSNLVADSSAVASSIEVLVFRVLLIFLILYIIYQLLRHNSNDKPSRKKYSNSLNDYKIKTSKKSKKRKNNRSKFENSANVIHTIHTGSGEYKFTQIQDYL